MNKVILAGRLTRDPETGVREREEKKLHIPAIHLQ